MIHVNNACSLLIKTNLLIKNKAIKIELQISENQMHILKSLSVEDM